VVRVAMLVLSPVLFFGLLEAGLRVGGYGFEPHFFVPAERAGLYKTNGLFTRRFFAAGLVRAPAACRLEEPKPARKYRIFILGESAAMGTPDSTFSFGRVLETMLRQAYPGTDFEVVNAAVTGINSHAIVPIARECAEYGPDLFVIYMGNNEVVGPYGPGTVFSRFSAHLWSIRASIAMNGLRSGQLIANVGQGLMARSAGPKRASGRTWEGMEMFVQNRVRADDPAMQVVYRHYEANLRDIEEAAAGAGAKTIVCTVAVNLRDCAPFASLHAEGLGAEAVKQWEQSYAAGNQAQDAGQHAQAIKAYQAAMKVDDRFAELRYRLGKSLLAMGEVDVARAEFVAARDLDALRFRTDSRQNQIVRQFAAEHAGDVALVDAEKELTQEAGAAIPGAELFYEHVHLRFEGNYLLAKAVFRQVQAGLPEEIRQRGATTRPAAASLEQCAAAIGFTDVARRSGVRSMAAMMARPPFTGQCDIAVRRQAMQQEVSELDRRLTPAAEEQAATTFREAIARNPKDPWLHHNLGVLELRRGQVSSAVGEFRAALKELPNTPSILDWLGLALAQQGQFAEAEQCFQRAVPQAPYSYEIRMDWVSVLGMQHKYDQALAALDEVAAMSGPTVDLHMLRAQYLMEKGAAEEAEGAYRAAMALAPEDPGPHMELAGLLAQRGALDEAGGELRAALKLDGRLAEAHLRLAELAAREGRSGDVIAECRAALAIRGDLAGAHFMLGQAWQMQGQAGAAVAELREELRVQKDWPPALRQLAWMLATSPDASVRNGADAVAAAEKLKAVMGTGAQNDPVVLDTLAAAYAEAGRFAEAVAVQTKAVEAAGLAGNAGMRRAMEQRLAGYREGKAWREAGGK
jgi:tetratricopeptide (TPR) repeat protein